MQNPTFSIFKSYMLPIALIASIVFGGFAGYWFKTSVLILKPLADIFLNLIFTTIVPLVFFSISSAIAQTHSLKTLRNIAFSMILVFIITSTIAAIFALVTVYFFPLTDGISLHLNQPEPLSSIQLSSHIANIFTVSDFSKLFSHEHILALILFSVLLGIATAQSGKKAVTFISFLQAGSEIFMRVFSLIMYYAPIGFFAYFAVLVSEIGPHLIESYVRIAIIYYASSLLYFVFIFTGYAYLAAGAHGIRLFWNAIFLPMVTAIATCSSAASIPANISAAHKIGISPVIYETAIPLGSIIHKDGSVIGGIFKIAFLFSVFHWDFSGFTVLLTALGVSLLVGTVMGAIPGGGMLGELFILSAYGFPSTALIAIAAISIIIDPLATMLNVTGNTVSTMLIARSVDGKKWFINHSD